MLQDTARSPRPATAFGPGGAAVALVLVLVAGVLPGVARADGAHARLAAPARTSDAAASHVPFGAGSSTLDVLGGGGMSGVGHTYQLLGRYTYWRSPAFGVAVEVYNGTEGDGFGPALNLTGGNLGLALRRHASSADLVLRAAVGGAYFSNLDLAPIVNPNDAGVALVGAGEASLVLHAGRSLGLVVGGRGNVLLPTGQSQPAWEAELVLGIEANVF